MSNVTSSMSDILEDPSLKCLLLDASGVLYTKNGCVEMAPEIIRRAHRKSIDVYVATNNSTLPVHEIVKKLEKMGFDIPAENIISSGMGLELDSNFRKYVHNKKCFCVGWECSNDYVLDAGGIIETNIENAESIILLSSFSEGNEEVFSRVGSYLQKNPHIPVICTNPDRYIQSSEGFYPVVGYYVDWLIKHYGIQVKWIGKPHENYSLMVKKILEKRGVEVGPGVFFFDDNDMNVKQMVKHLNIQGFCVLETGLSKEKIIDQDPSAPITFVSKFSL